MGAGRRQWLEPRARVGAGGALEWPHLRAPGTRDSVPVEGAERENGAGGDRRGPGSVSGSWARGEGQAPKIDHEKPCSTVITRWMCMHKYCIYTI